MSAERCNCGTHTKAACDFAGACKPVIATQVAPIWFMRDNHTFKKLTEDVATAMVEIRYELDDGYTSGMLSTRREGAPGPMHFRYQDIAGSLVKAEEWLTTVIGPAPLPTAQAPTTLSTLGQQVARAQAEMAKWSPELRASVRLEGGDAAAPAACPICPDGKLIAQQTHWCDKCGTTVATTADCKANVWHMKAAAAPTEQADEVNTVASLEDAQGTDEDLTDAADLVNEVAHAKTNGDALFAVLKYRQKIRLSARQAPTLATNGDAIAKSKRILNLVDDYKEVPNADNRTKLRKALMDEFEAVGRAPTEAEGVTHAWFHQQSSFGPWIECNPSAPGATTFFTGAPVVKALCARQAPDSRDAAIKLLRTRLRAAVGVMANTPYADSNCARWAADAVESTANLDQEKAQ